VSSLLTGGKVPESSQKKEETSKEPQLMIGNQQLPTQFVSRIVLPAQSKAKSRRRKTEPLEETTQMVSEAMLRERAAWKQVEETGKPLQFEDKLFIPDGMSIWKAIEFLPDGIREQVRSAMQQKVADVHFRLVQQQRTEILKKGEDDSKWAEYRTFPYVAQLAVADWLVRQKLGFPEMSIRELIEVYGGKVENVSENDISE